MLIVVTPERCHYKLSVEKIFIFKTLFWSFKKDTSGPYLKVLKALPSGPDSTPEMETNLVCNGHGLCIIFRAGHAGIF